MSLFELEKSMSFDKYIGSFDAEHVEKVCGFVDWLAQYSGRLVHNPWGEVNPDLEIVTEGFDAAQVRRDNLVAYLLPRLGRAKVFVVAEAVGYQGGRFTGIAITCERMLLDKHKTIRAKDVTPIRLERTSSPSSHLLKGAQQKDGFNEPTDTVVWNAIMEKGIDPYDTLLWNIFPFHPYKEGNPLTNRTPTDKEQQLGWEYTKRLLDLHFELGGAKPFMLAVGQKSADTMGKFGLSAVGLRHPANGGANLYRQGFAEAVEAMHMKRYISVIEENGAWHIEGFYKNNPNDK
ncbi:uracil-DNA glycosylase [uncultured Veillonella sp.]|uniref:uracil-DNA glycosylase n=1 Tax=uncultured Veillonella sp. TaxID=159268 RepID=UPI0028DC5B52|nr:uracil-DNA glycosylase [uncultured Veillonella sp.]